MTLLVLALVGCGWLGGMPARPNILLITLDTTRADHLGSYGYFRQTSPNLDRLARRSIFFEDLVVPMATTLPTHTSILTGTSPLEHGVLANVKHGGARFVASPALRTLPQHLKTHGYRTGAFVSATPLKKGTGIEAGFDHFDEPAGRERRAARTTEAAAAWLAEHDDAPFFAWVHYYDAHGPFHPLPDWEGRFTTDAAHRAWMEARRATAPADRPGGHPLEPFEASNAYDAEIGGMDASIGALIDRGHAEGWLDDTLIVVIGDHGEGLGQHGMAGHGAVWLEQLHAPFFIVSPWHPARRVRRPVTAADVIPTLLGLIELPDEAALWAQTSGLDALSDAPDRPIYSQSSARQAAIGVGEVWSIVDGRWHYLHLEDGERLYDRVADPHELEDLAGREPEVLRRLRAEAERLRTEQVARGEALGRGGAAPLDADTVEELRALGYVE